MRFSLPSAKNPTDRPSGDQNGHEAPSVPVNGRAETASRERNDSRDRPSSVATKTIFCPSGEIASDTGSAVAGVVISRRISGGAGGGASRRCRTVGMASATAASNATANATQASRPPDADDVAVAVVCGAVVSNAPSSARRTSPFAYALPSDLSGDIARSSRRTPASTSAAMASPLRVRASPPPRACP